MIGLLSSKFLISSIFSKPFVLGTAATLARGGGAVTGIAILESTKGAPISSQLKSGAETVSTFLSSSGTASAAQQSNSNFLSTFFQSTLPSTFQTLIQGVTKLSETLKNSVIQTVQFFSNLGVTLNSFQEVKQQLEGIQHSLGGDATDLREFFESIHKKIPNLVSFFSDSSKSDSFVGLFKGGELEKTKKTLKILLGKDQSTKQVIIAEPGLGVALINQFAKDPEKVNKKIKRLVELVDKITKPPSSGASQGSDSTQSSTSEPYKLTRDKLSSFLKERQKNGQEGFELGLILEIGAQQQGYTLPSTTANLFSILGTLLGSSPTQSSEQLKE